MRAYADNCFNFVGFQTALSCTVLIVFVFSWRSRRFALVLLLLCRAGLGHVVAVLQLYPSRRPHEEGGVPQGRGCCQKLAGEGAKLMLMLVFVGVVVVDADADV